MAIKVNNYYICTKKIEGIEKSQLVKIDAIYNDSKEKIVDLELSLNKSDNLPNLPREIRNIIYKKIHKNTLYEYHYGFLGFHEGYCKKSNLRELTKDEKDIVKNGCILSLPRQFYDA